jgi:single-strand DNA-binding protein
MNKSILMGRLTKTPELRTTQSGVSVASFTVAVNRRFKNQEGGHDADFINCIAWRNQADVICRFFGKGDMIGIVGSIQTRNYDNKEGQKVYVTEVVVEEVHFCGGKKEAEPRHNDMPSEDINQNPGFMPMHGGDDLTFYEVM